MRLCSAGYSSSSSCSVRPHTPSSSSLSCTPPLPRHVGFGLHTSTPLRVGLGLHASSSASSCWVWVTPVLLRLVALGWATAPRWVAFPVVVPAILSSSLYSLLRIVSALLGASALLFLLVVSAPFLISTLCVFVVSAHPFFVVSALLFLFAVRRSRWGDGASGGAGVVQPSPACQQPRPLSLASMPISLHRWNSRARVFAARAEAGEGRARGGGGGPLSAPSLSLVLSPLLSFASVWFASTSSLSLGSSTWWDRVTVLRSAGFKVIGVS